MSLVIVEGCDGSGKTTLIDRVRRECSTYFWSMRGIGRPPPNRETIIDLSNLALQLSWAGPFFVMDRHPLISEPIYGPILRGETLLAPSYVASMLRKLATARTKLIICMPPLKQAQRNSKIEEQLEGVEKSYAALYQSYIISVRYWRELGLEVAIYDYTSQTEYKGWEEDLFFAGLHA